MSLVIVKVNVEIMTESIMKPIDLNGLFRHLFKAYLWWVMSVSGCSGCLTLLGFGGSFLGLIVFLICLGKMLVGIWLHYCYVCGWVSSLLVFGVLLTSILLEIGILFATNYYEGLDRVLEFNSLGG